MSGEEHGERWRVQVSTFYSVFSKFLVIATPAYLKAKCFDLQALPIFLDSLVQAWGAILISVTLILLFGEVGVRYLSSGRERVFYFHYILLLEPTYKPTAPDLALCFRLGLIIKIRWLSTGSLWMIILHKLFQMVNLHMIHICVFKSCAKKLLRD